jgi:hypothetical protein
MMASAMPPAQVDEADEKIMITAPLTARSAPRGAAYPRRAA